MLWNRVGCAEWPRQRSLMSESGNQVSYFRFSIDLKAIDRLLHVTIGIGYSFMLTKMLGPRIQHEAFNKNVALRGIFIDAPSECPVTPSLACEVCDGTEKLFTVFWMDSIFNCYQNRPSV